MSKSSRSAKSFLANAASKLPSSKKDDSSSKPKKSNLGEKTERTESKGNLGKQQQVQAAVTPAQRKAAAPKVGNSPSPDRGGLKGYFEKNMSGPEIGVEGAPVPHGFSLQGDMSAVSRSICCDSFLFRRMHASLCVCLQDLTL
ncbi:hypothetical protein STEG23_036231 [Scotinomys teguina]